MNKEANITVVNEKLNEIGYEVNIYNKGKASYVR